MKVHCLFVLSRLLGGATFSRAVESILEELPGVYPIVLDLTEDDFQHYRRSAWLGNSQAIYIVRRKFAREVRVPFDCLFLSGLELAVAFGDVIRKVPTILAHDSTDVLSHELVRGRDQSWAAHWCCRLKTLVTSPLYRRVFPHVDVFLPRTGWCASSLSIHYGIDPSRMIVTPGGIDVDVWRPGPLRRQGKPRLLFVGNDFERKGGPLLLDVCRTHLHGTADVTIISNDAIWSHASLPEGVHWRSGLGAADRDEMRRLYQEADLFVFPTRKEQMGQVLLEAAACGLPIIASDVGGVSQVVRHGLNGILVPPGAGPDAWAGEIGRLLSDPSLRKRFGDNGRHLAEAEFSRSVLRSNLERAISMAICEGS